jgi:hypothetical protein
MILVDLLMKRLVVIGFLPCHDPLLLQVFGGMSITKHRYHAAYNHERFTRLGNNPNGDDDHTYQYTACPGIDNPAGQFPIIDTLLSVPFSLLHCLPRLASLLSPTAHQQQLIVMGYEIMKLWWWEPTPELKEQSRRIRITVKKKTQPNPPPKPIHLITATFATIKPIIAFGTSTAHSSGGTSHQIASSVELPSGQIVSGTMPPVSLDRDGLLLTVVAEPTSVTSANKSFITSSRATMAWDTQSTKLTKDSDAIDESTEGSDVDKTYLPSSDIISWYENMVDCAPEPLLPLPPTPFERGNIGGQSVNDVLMIKGLIHPPVYLQFFDLNSFPLL